MKLLTTVVARRIVTRFFSDCRRSFSPHRSVFKADRALLVPRPTLTTVAILSSSLLAWCFTKPTENEPKNGHSDYSTMANFRKEKEMYLKMALEEKRKHYKCRADYVELSKIPTWTPSYFSERKAEAAAAAYTPNAQMAEKVAMWLGDITTLEVDAIVNAANKKMLGGGGVDGAIHRAAGPSLKEECATLNGCDTGDAKITGGYKLPAKYVIHTVGPVGAQPDKLRSCYETCLNLMKQNSLRTIAFPCVSTGVYGYPNKDAANVALNTVRQWLEKDGNINHVDRIIFCLFLNDDLTAYSHLLPVYFPVPEAKM